MNKKNKRTPKKNRKRTLKNWLKDNKIYFETIMTISLTIMGICISIVSLLFEKQALEIQEHQIAITEQLNLPVFNVSQKIYQEDYTIEGINYPAGIEISVLNNGGNIENGYLRSEARLEIIVHDENYDSVASIVLENTQRFLKNYSYYDAQSKSFTIKKDFDLRNVELRTFLDQQLRLDYNTYIFTIVTIDYINIQYKDYQGILHNEWYELSGGELQKRTPTTPDKYDALQINSMNNSDIYRVITKFLDELLA